MSSVPPRLARRTLLSLPFVPFAAHAAARASEYRFAHEHVLGTSLELRIRASSAAIAHAAESAVLAEVERLRRLLSTYDPVSGISGLNAATAPVRCSPELYDLLTRYESWHHRTRGVITANLGQAIATWQEAAARQQVPPAFDVSPVPGFRLDRRQGLVHRAPGARLNVDALGKAYILRRAVAAAYAAAPRLSGLCLNIGGDLVTAGRDPWPVDVTDPAAPHENAPPLTTFALTAASVATSGGYERGYRIAGHSYSHILDPRTGRPAVGAASATVIAPDSITANALATALCILPAHAGLSLVASTRGAECLIVPRSGSPLRSPGFARYERPRIVRAYAPTGWPAGQEVSITLTLKAPRGDRPKRPYIAVWAEDTHGKLIRNIAVWAGNPRWLVELTQWYQLNSGPDADYTQTRATRPPGRYRIAWDGRDEKGQPVPPGTYRIIVEASREHGFYAKEAGTIACAAQPASLTLKATAEYEAVTIEYGPRPQAA